MNKKIVLITGTSSGFGLHTAVEMARLGYFVIATMRNLNRSKALVCEIKQHSLEKMISIEQLDVTDEESISSFQQIVKNKYKRIDILINNAGYACGGFVEELPLDAYRKQFDTNLFGIISITKIVLPLMREQQSGAIINISSISGLIGFPGLSAYAASKYALEGFTESLKFEVKQFGIDVLLIEPGSYQTKIWKKAKSELIRGNNGIIPYIELQAAIEKHLQNEDTFGDPKKVAKLISEITIRSKPKFRNLIGKGTKTTIVLKTLLPWSLWEYFVLKKLRKK